MGTATERKVQGKWREANRRRQQLIQASCPPPPPGPVLETVGKQREAVLHLNPLDTGVHISRVCSCRQHKSRRHLMWPQDASEGGSQSSYRYGSERLLSVEHAVGGGVGKGRERPGCPPFPMAP